MTKKTKAGFALLFIALALAFSGCVEEKAPEPIPEIPSKPVAFEQLNLSNVTTTWNLSFLCSTIEEALAQFEALKLRSEYSLNDTYRPQFTTLSGTVLLDYLEDEKDFLKALTVLWIYAILSSSKHK